MKKISLIFLTSLLVLTLKTSSTPADTQNDPASKDTVPPKNYTAAEIGKIVATMPRGFQEVIIRDFGLEKSLKSKDPNNNN